MQDGFRCILLLMHDFRNNVIISMESPGYIYKLSVSLTLLMNFLWRLTYEFRPAAVARYY